MPLPNGFENELDSRLTRLLSTIRAQCGDPQPPLALKTAIDIIYIGYQNRRGEVAGNVLEDAKERDLVVEWVDEDGRVRLGLTPGGFDALPDQSLYSDADIDALHAVAEVESERQAPDQEIVGWVNEWVNRIKGSAEQSEIEVDSDG